MYPQTHVYFAEIVLGKQGDEVTLGSIIPDMLIGRYFNHYEAHSKGAEMLSFLKRRDLLLDFGKAVATHGFVPQGLDYYGDEKYLDFERGYCFEKARALVQETVEACNIPPEMGWWKAHNIVEMGVESLVSSSDYYSERIKSALFNMCLISEIDEMLHGLWKNNDFKFERRIERFAKLVEIERATAGSLARIYQVQMRFKHQVEIDIPRVARLIERAAEVVDEDLASFFDTTMTMVTKNINRFFPGAPGNV